MSAILFKVIFGTKIYDNAVTIFMLEKNLQFNLICLTVP